MTDREIRTGEKVAYLIVVLIACAVATIFFFLFFERPYLRYTNVPFPALTSIGFPGKPMPVHVSRCNDDSVPHVYEISRTLERVTSKPDEPRDYIMMPDLRVNILPGCSEGDSVAHIIPLLTPPGMWRLVGLSEVRGVLTTHMVEWYSVPFEVQAAASPTKGERGETGATGAKGSTGKVGATGATGATGAKGSFWGGKQ